VRDFLYHFAWLALLPISFFSAHLGILLWIWIALLPPIDLMYGSLGVVLPFNKLAAASVFFCLLTKASEKRFYFDFLLGVAGLYALVVTLSYFLAPYSHGAADGQYDKFWKELVLAMLITGLMFTRHRLHQVALVVAVTFGFYMAKEGIIFLLTAGGHHVEGSGVTGDNNGLALAILMIIPLLLYVASHTAEHWVRMGMYATAVMGAVTVVASYSRGGFIGLIALGVMLLKGNRHKVRSTLLIAVMAVILYHLMPSDYLERIDTIKEASADESFNVRLVAWKVNFLMALDHPILGTGPYGSLAVENWFSYVERASTFLFPTPIIYRSFVAHSIYFQVLGDTGFLGLFLFLLMLFTALIYTITTQRMARKDPALAWAGDLARATQISMVMYLVCGAALSNVYFEVLYIILAVVSRNHQTVREALATGRVPARAAVPARAIPAFSRGL
jgi:probable O-glycosylation ligase (exosortase A-associated)